MRKHESTYKSPRIPALLTPSRSYHLPQQARVHLRRSLEHLLRTLAQHLWVAVEPRKVQTHEQRPSLDIVDAVGEKVRNGVGYLLGLYGVGRLAGCRP